MKRLFVLALIVQVVLVMSTARGAEPAYAIATAPQGEELALSAQEDEDWFWVAFVAVVVLFAVGVGITKVVQQVRNNQPVGIHVNAKLNFPSFTVDVDDIELETEINATGPLIPDMPSFAQVSRETGGIVRFTNESSEPQNVVLTVSPDESSCYALDVMASLGESAEASFNFALTSPEDGTLFTAGNTLVAAASSDTAAECFQETEIIMTIDAGEHKDVNASLLVTGRGSSGSVGGIAELPDVAGTALETPDSSGGPGAGVLAGAIAGAVTAGGGALGGAAWYVRRRLLR